MADALTIYFGMTNPEVGASSDSWGTKENADRVTVDQLLATGSAWVAAGGTVNAITATYSPALLVLADGVMCAFRASGANTSTTPTFAPNGLTARTIVKSGGVALAVNDIPRGNYECLLRYNLANTRWELLNPASAPGVQSGVTGASSSGVPITLYTMVGTSGLYIIYANVQAANDPANYGAYAVLFRDSGGNGIRLTTVNGVLLTITLSGADIQATQSSGTTGFIEWSVFKIGA